MNRKNKSETSCRCLDCSKVLTKDDVGATFKLLGREEKRKFCVACLSRRLHVEEERVQYWIDNWKYQGCKLFE